MNNPLSDPRVLWPLRDLMRRPLEWFFLTLALSLITAIPATALLLVQGLSGAAAAILADAPSLIVRKIDPTGWTPVPVEESLQALRGVPGVLRAYPRTWGVVGGPASPVTVVTASTIPPGGQAVGHPINPEEGRVLVGSGVAGDTRNDQLALTGRTTRIFRVAGVLDRKTAMASHDLVVMNPRDARRLLGLPEGYASDIAIDVYHDGEEAAMLPDLVAALPWPVRITTRTENLKYLSGAYTRRGGIVILATIPALAAICLLVAATVRERLGRRFEIGLLNAFGWTTTDIVRQVLLRALFVGVPAVCLGMGLAFMAVCLPGVAWPGVLLFGWQGRAPALYLSAGSSLLSLLQIAALTLIPFLMATLVPTLKVATTDTRTFFEGGSL